MTSPSCCVPQGPVMDPRMLYHTLCKILRKFKCVSNVYDIQPYCYGQGSEKCLPANLCKCLMDDWILSTITCNCIDFFVFLLLHGNASIIFWSFPSWVRTDHPCFLMSQLDYCNPFLHALVSHLRDFLKRLKWQGCCIWRILLFHTEPSMHPYFTSRSLSCSGQSILIPRRSEADCIFLSPSFPMLSLLPLLLVYFSAIIFCLYYCFLHDLRSSLFPYSKSNPLTYLIIIIKANAHDLALWCFSALGSA